MVVTGPPRSRFAEHPERSRGRRLFEPPSRTRNDFQRDRDRIIHSTAFRRLKDKTQVFVFDEGDHYRTRLTHTIEVSQIARALARSLGLDEDLAETLALAHDLGHPPFGHSGEDELDRCMRPWGGFDHNRQSLRIVTRLERRYAAHDGLNLTWEALEGLVKHNGPLTPERLPPWTEDLAGLDLAAGSWASAEAQAAAIADDIAYAAHDIDDGLRAGLITIGGAAEAVPLLGRLLAEVDRIGGGPLDPPRRLYELVRRLITRLIEDVVAESASRLDALAGEGADRVREAGRAVVAFSPAMAGEERALKAFLLANVYRADRVMAVRARADAALQRLFERYLVDPGALPPGWRTGADDPARHARTVCDFIAGMTERFALQEHLRLFDEPAELR